MARLQDLENKEVAEHWFNKGMQIGADPLPHPSKDERKKPDPNQPPSSPYEPYKSPHKLDLAHDFWDGESLADKWGAVWNDREGNWLLPPDSPNGNHRFASDEERQMLEEDALHREQFDRDTPHHQEGWDQAGLYMGEQFPNKFDQILNPRGDFSKPSLDQLRKGVEEKRRTGGVQMADASAANKITPLSPWRTRLKDDPRHVKELYDPITGMSMSDWKRQGG